MEEGSDDAENRGLADDVQLQYSNNILGLIASLALPLLHWDIIDKTTKLTE